MTIGDILGGAPPWAYALLLVLIALGVRRLTTREVPVVVAMIPVIAFAAWSLVGVTSAARQPGYQMAIAGWTGGIVVGIASALVLPEARGVRLPGKRVRLPGSPSSLVLYLAVFVGRFACGAWAATEPSQAAVANAIGAAIGAAMTARLVASVVQWRRAVD